WGEIPASMPAKDLAFTGTYTVNRYAVVYKVDGKVYKTDSVEYNAPITVEPAPVKEGHTFSGWSEVPSLMPAKDVEVTGSFTVNRYEIVFIFDGEVVEKDSVAYGSVLVAPDVEEKEGHSVTWDKLPKTMPANDLTINGRYIANVYILVYKVDGVVYKTYNVTYNAPITVEPAPVKEGHTFSGWSEVPSLMPAKDVEVTGSFTVNQYNVTFVVDGEVIAEYVVNYGETISLPETPAKEGHTFSGWDGVPETMPAKDLTISGTFVINKYLVTFKIGDEVIASYSLEYGAAIVIPEAPAKEGHTFNGWGEVAETVPAGDVTYEGTYTVNIYKVYYYVGEELVHTAEVAYGEAIPEYVYEPAEEGYTFLGWVGETYTTMPAHDVTYTANIDDAIGHLTIDNGELTIYDLAGRKVTDTENLRSGIYIINGRKVIVK
ncbi:MAG: InlB B-repeat-containing protein, partial [Bacteroidaceae bacterium]|nr:InlB B-repeat-containing protein [Bacteroidaceae bacterium]